MNENRDRSKKGDTKGLFRRHPKFSDPPFSLRCLIDRDPTSFVIRPNPTCDIGALKPLILINAVNGSLRGTDSKDLTLCKVSDVCLL